MGCMVINTYLLANPNIELAGVIFQAPFFQFGGDFRMNFAREVALRFLRPLLKPFAINAPFSLQALASN